MVISKLCTAFTTVDLEMRITNSIYSTVLQHLSSLSLCCTKFPAVNVTNISTVMKTLSAYPTVVPEVWGPSLQYGCPPLAVDDDRVE